MQANGDSSREPFIAGTATQGRNDRSWKLRALQCISVVTCFLSATIIFNSLGFRQFFVEPIIGLRHAPKKPIDIPASEEKAGGPIWFQAHSFNDLRQWESLYLKGARSFKLDPHFVKGDGSIFNRTRMVFTHNLPFSTKKTRYDDFESLFHELSPLGGIGSRLRTEDEQIRVQLCFKSPPALVCNITKRRRSREQLAWIDIIDDFYDRVDGSGFIDEHVEFLLDGGGKPSGCLRNKWRKWKSVWIMGDSLSPSSALTTGDETQEADNSRFVLLNNQVSLNNWQTVAKLGFGRFNSLPYPYQIWEPSDMQTISDHAEVFFRTKPEHPAGLHFVSNSDPVMVALYSGATGTFNRPLLVDAQMGCPLGLVASKSRLHLVYSYGGQNRYRSSFFKRELGMEAVHIATDEGNVNDPVWTRFVPDTTGMGLFSNDQGVFKRVWMRPWDGKLIDFGGQMKAPRPEMIDDEKKLKCLVIRRSGYENDFVALWSLKQVPMPTVMPTRSNTPTRAPSAGVSKGPSRQPTPASITPSPSTQGPTISSFGANPLRFLSTSANTSALDLASSSKNNDIDPIATECVVYGVVFRVHGLSNDTHLVSSLCLMSREVGRGNVVDGDLVPLSSKDVGVVISDQQKIVLGTIWDVKSNDTLSREPYVLGVGSSPRFAYSDEANVVSLFLTDSVCSNNEDLNKRAGPTALCDNPAVSSRGVMTYTVGYKSSWIKALRVGRALSACDIDLLHGAYDVGACPVGFISLIDAKDGAASLLSVHKTIDDLRSNEKACGYAKWTNSLILSKVPLFFSSEGKHHRHSNDVRLLAR